MNHWKIKNEIDNEENNPLIVYIDNDGQEFETMFDAPKQYLDILTQGVYLSDVEVSTIEFLSQHYSTSIAIDAVTAFRFKDGNDKIDAKFMLAPSLQEAREYFKFIDSADVKECLEFAGISGRRFSKDILASERTMRDKLNDLKTKSQLSLSEKYLAFVLFYKK